MAKNDEKQIHKKTSVEKLNKIDEKKIAKTIRHRIPKNGEKYFFKKWQK